MVCIAAFIILALIGIFVAIISIFKPQVWKSYVKMFKKSWGCLWKKVRLQKCETGFKDDVKNTLLSRVIVKHPKWVKPLSVLIEVLSILIVVVAVWAILTAIKSLLALWALGSCNVTKPSACSLGAEMCSIDQSEPTNFFEATGRWFTEWGDIFEAIPDKFKTYEAEDYRLNYITYPSSGEAERPVALSIFDPGCTVCLSSYLNEKASGFFDKYDVRLVPFAIQDADGRYKFANSETIVRYMFAGEQLRAGLSVRILDRLFTEKDEEGRSWQMLFNDIFSAEEATATLDRWLADFGLDAAGNAELKKIAAEPEVTAKMTKNREIVENELRVNGIPTLVYDGAKHTGLYKAE